MVKTGVDFSLFTWQEIKKRNSLAELTNPNIERENIPNKGERFLASSLIEKPPGKQNPGGKFLIILTGQVNPEIVLSAIKKVSLILFGGFFPKVLLEKRRAVHSNRFQFRIF